MVRPNIEQGLLAKSAHFAGHWALVNLNVGNIVRMTQYRVQPSRMDVSLSQGIGLANDWMVFQVQSPSAEWTVRLC
jgi:hypothetical protein